MGRPKGALNKTTAQVKEAAQKHTQAAIDTLVQIMTTGEAEPARIAAARELLDRGHGKPSQAMEVSGEGGGPIATVVKHIYENK